MPPYHKSNGLKKDLVKEAAKGAGWLLKSVLAVDKREL